MLDYICLGSAPADEDCVQVGNPDYHNLARPECQRYLELIRDTVGVEPPGALLCIKTFPHDFGSYMEVCCVYDDEIEEAVAYAFKCEAEAPVKWEEQPCGSSVT